MDVRLHLDSIEPWAGRAALDAQCAAHATLLDEARQGMPAFRGSTGWMDVRRYAGEEALARIREKARLIRADADVFVLVGVGGSNNAARSVIEALCPGGRPEILYAGNSTAPSAMEAVLRRLAGRSVYIDVIAKNFETLEPGAAFRILRQFLSKQYGADAAKRITVTGTPGSRLHRLAAENGWDFFLFPEDVGGRYSALTDVGLLPMAVAGADIEALVRGAETMRAQLLETPAAENPAVRYAAARSLLEKAGFRAELLSVFEPALAPFLKWWIQLFGESCGKDGRGLFPAGCSFSEELHAIGQFLQDGTPLALETFLDAAERTDGPALQPDGVDDGFSYLDGKPFSALNRAAFAATVSAHARRLPCLLLQTPPPGEEMLGGLFYFFMLACAFSCRMDGVDPFDQPGVEAYKASMFRSLERTW